MEPTYLTPPEIAKRLRVSPDKVIGWIRAGELRGVNVAARRDGKKARWRIELAELLAFQERRGSLPPVRRQQRRRERDDVIQFL